MSLKSMTGFGRGEAAVRGVRAVAELSSVNRKQLEVRVAVPRALTALESSVTREVSKTFSRGHVTGSITVTRDAGTAPKVDIDLDLATAYVSELRRVAAQLGLPDDISARNLLNIRGVLEVSSLQPATEDAWPAVRKAVKAAIAELVTMRRKEGAALETDLVKRFGKLRGKIDKITKLAPRVVRRHRKELRTRLASTGLEFPADDPAILRELAMFADRSDIAEELTRLSSHMDQAEQMLGSSKPVGRSLDFLAQEMFREINTTGAKASDPDISRHVIVFKTELERIREQVQNVE